MKIVCEACSAAYTIDDAQLGPTPIGAQCPYCGHVRLVQAPEAEAPAAPSESELLDAFEFEPSVEAPAPIGDAPRLELSDDIGAPPEPAADTPGWLATAGDDAMAVNMPEPSSDGLGIALDTDGGPMEPPGPGEEQGRCRECGVELRDEFDRVIGLCETHQDQRREPETAEAVASWHVLAPTGRRTGPMSLEELRNRIRSGEFRPSDQFSRDGARFEPLTRFSELAYLAKPAGPTGGRAMSAAVPAKSGRRFRRGVFAVVGALGVALLGGAYWKRAAIRSVVTRLHDGATKVSAKAPNPLIPLIAGWPAPKPGDADTPASLVARARKAHAKDTWAHYAEAEALYQRALVLDPEDIVAMAGWVENFSLWRAPRATPAERSLMQSVLGYAEQRQPGSPDVARARAAFGLAQGDLGGCQADAEAALKLDATDARATLLVAGCLMEGNVALGAKRAERAAELEPSLLRAGRVRAAAYARAGRFSEALDLLDARLRREPKNDFVLRDRAAIARGLGELDNAEKLLSRAIRAGGDVQASRLALGALRLELGQTTRAAALFKRAVEGDEPAGGRSVDAYTGWARAELYAGRPKRALVVAEKAVAIDRRSAAAHFVHAESLLLTGASTVAAGVAAKGLELRPGEPALLALAGRVAFARGQSEDGLKKLRAAVSVAPNDPRYRGILASMYLRIGGATQAYTIMKRAAEIDPEVAFHRGRHGALALSPAAVDEAAQAFLAADTDEANRAVAAAAAAALYFHNGDRRRATRMLRRALDWDPANVPALIYFAEIELERGRPQGAIRSARKVLRLEHGSALAYLMLGRAYRSLERWRDAREAYAAALRSNPGLLAAKIELAGVRVQRGDDAARAVLRSAFQLAPQNLVLRRLLWKFGDRAS